MVLLSTKPIDTLVNELDTLQSKILTSGPRHFSSTYTSPLAFAKIASLALCPTVAIEWIIHSQPELRVSLTVIHSRFCML